MQLIRGFLFVATVLGALLAPLWPWQEWFKSAPVIFRRDPQHADFDTRWRECIDALTEDVRNHLLLTLPPKRPRR